MAEILQTWSGREHTVSLPVTFYVHLTAGNENHFRELENQEYLLLVFESPELFSLLRLPHRILIFCVNKYIREL